MAKKKEVFEVAIENPALKEMESDSVEKPKVAPLAFDLGRDDLNLLRDKINEIITYIG